MAKKWMLLATIGASLPISGALAQATPAPAAQEGVSGAETSPSPQGSSDRDIVVTGSRIVRRDYVANSPIATIGQPSIERSGSVTLETALTRLPQFTASTGSTTNSNGNGGQANIQLRGLGRQRTLVLLDGRRLPSANDDASVDINMIPSALIQGVEVITGGASAVYGSDAVAGVVNFKLRRSVDGFMVDAQNGITDRGDAGDRKVSLAAGTGFADGRGNVVISAEYAQRDLIFLTARNFTFGANRSLVLPYGVVTFDPTNQPSQAALNAVFGRYGVAPGTVVRGNAISFNPDGTIFSTGRTVQNYRGTTDPTLIVNNGVTVQADSRRFRYLQLPLERWSGYGRANFEVSDALSLSVQGLYTHTESSTQLGPAPTPGTTGISGVPVTNPFIPADFRTLLASRANPNATFDISLAPSSLARNSAYVYDTYQVVAAAEGKLGLGDWTYALTGIYGRTDIDLLQTRNITASRILRLVRAPDGGASLCTGGFNPFGDAPVSQSCAEYVSPDLSTTSDATQKSVEATVQGGLIDLPAGSVRAALGAGYRRDGYAVLSDPALTAGDVFAGRGTTFDGAIGVAEAFAELSIPVLADTFLFNALNVDLAYRYSDYSTVGGVHSYKADGYWEPVRGMRFRGGYERAVRAPNIGENFAPQRISFTNLGAPGTIGSGDPCDIRGAYRRGPNNAQVRALCLAQGIPALVIDNYNSAGSAQILTGGNPDLREETADTYTAGIVLTPKLSSALLQNLSVSVDFYSIKVEDAIGSITTAISLQRCFNATGASNPNYEADNFFCSLLTRDPASGGLSQSRELLFNLGGYRVSGIDLQATWASETGAGRLLFNLTGTYLRRFKIQSLPADPFLDYAGTIGNSQVDLVAISRPRFKGIFDVTYSLGGFRLGGQWRYIGKMDSFANVGATNPDAVGVPAVSYFDANIGYRLNDRFEIWGTVSNIGDRQPPVFPSQGLTDLATYDVLGRKFTLGIRTRF